MNPYTFEVVYTPPMPAPRLTLPPTDAFAPGTIITLGGEHYELRYDYWRIQQWKRLSMRAVLKARADGRLPQLEGPVFR